MTALKVRQLLHFNLLICHRPVKRFGTVCRMKPAYSGKQMHEFDRAIARRVAEAGVTEHQLDAADTAAANQHLRRKGVADGVWSNRAADTVLADFSDDIA